MLITNPELEPEGLEAVLIGLEKTTVLRELHEYLTDPFFDEPGHPAELCELDLDLRKLPDLEVKAAAGVFYGLACSVDVEQYPQTFNFCVQLFLALNDEINRRRTTPCASTMN